MGKILKPGRVVMMLSGRQAGRKGVVVQANDAGSKERPFPHALVAGISRPPKKITKKMSKKSMEKRSKIKAFLQYVNYNHVMPTRYTISSQDLDPKSLVEGVDMKDNEQKQARRKAIRETFQELIVTPGAKGDKISKDVIFFRRRLQF
eukprot:CAMPEP_0113846950 /NCGR_PEP_ID=MMETSP0372-20130328/1593_1 /TAXON_ID=340204 /ORGANISM="Lankesteria abbotti" /LENGTH=147 /DNA_ID=CAMNT_0000816153 /DNA_START=32 /DNA_END=475 /DNA_ORIENTATION=+ /assembly_acc=CAM_ASM_000359